MNKILTYLCLIAMSVALSIAVMYFGWGLHVLSWRWVIGGGVFGQTVLKAIYDVVEKEFKE